MLIKIKIFLGAMPMIVATTYCLPMLLRWLGIMSYCIFSLWGLYKVNIKFEVEKFRIT